MEVKMQNQIYDHRVKVGNQGDLIKHFALSVIADEIEKKRDRSPFVYVETHSGRSSYQLDVDNLSEGWKSGVGGFLEQTKDFQYSDDAEILSDGVVLFRSILKKSIEPNAIKYQGSSALVRSTLNEHGINNHAVLFDTNPDVCEQLENDEQVIVKCEDGYEGVKQLGDIDLVFIDPPDLKPAPDGHFQKYKDLIFYCINNEISFVSWNPLYGNAAGDGPSKECHIICEVPRVQNVAMTTVRWSDWSSKMCGCQMIFGCFAGSHYAEITKSLGQFMGWKAESR